MIPIGDQAKIFDNDVSTRPVAVIHRTALRRMDDSVESMATNMSGRFATWLEAVQ